MKKKLLSLFLALSLVVGMLAILGTSATVNENVCATCGQALNGVRGDLNADGVVDIADIVEVIDIASGVCTVTFVDHDGRVLKTEKVENGESATAPDAPTRDGYTFAGWDKAFDNVKGDMTVTATYTLAVTDPYFEVANATANAGDESVSLTVRFLNNPGILGTKLTVTYDDSVMTLKNAVNGDALSGLTYTKPSRYKNGCNFMWFGSECGETADATVLTLVFDIFDTAASGTYAVNVACSASDTYDESYGSLTIDVKNGSITIR